MLFGAQINFRNVIENDLLLLRNWRNSDAMIPYSGQFKLLNSIDQKNWFVELANTNSDRIMFIITNKKNIPIGICGLTNIDYRNKKADIAIMIGNVRIQGKGYGSEALKILLKYGFKKMNLHRIEAQVFDFNHVSIKLFERANFKLESILRSALWRYGRWHDIRVYSILDKEFID